jgi:hypothetical protein
MGRWDLLMGAPIQWERETAVSGSLFCSPVVTYRRLRVYLLLVVRTPVWTSQAE